MEMLKSVLWDYRFIILVVVAIIVYGLLEREKFKSKAYALMLQAKRAAKDEFLSGGEEQVAWVVDKLYIFLPRYLAALIPQKYMTKIVATLYDKAKDYLDDGEFNNSLK